MIIKKKEFDEIYKDFTNAYAAKYGEGSLINDLKVAQARMDALLTHKENSAKRSAFGQKGGLAKVPKGFATNKELARVAGRKGGINSGKKRKNV